MKALKAAVGAAAAVILLAQGATQAAPIVWKTSRAAAMAAAQGSGKLVLLMAGRETCGNCQNMKYTVCELPAIRAIIDARYVCWFNVVDDNTTVWEWAPYVAGWSFTTTPLICVIDPNNPWQFLSRTQGNQDAAAFQVRLESHVPGAAPRLFVTPTNRAVLAKAGWTSFRVSNSGTGTMNYQATETSSWLRISSGATGGNSGVVVLAIASNRTPRSRTNLVTVRAPGASGSPKRVRIVQQKAGPVLTVTPTNRVIEPTTLRTTFKVSNSGIGRFVYRATETSTWMRIAGVSRGTNRGTIVVTCGSNTSVSARTGMVTVTASGASGSPKRLKIVQKGVPVLAVNPPGKTVDCTAGTTDFAVANTGGGTMAYTATAVDPWLHIVGGGTGGNSGTIQVAYDPNTGIPGRTGYVTVATSGDCCTRTDLQVVQKGQPRLSVTPTTLDVSGRAGVATFTVVNLGGGTFNYTATESSTWFDITGGATGSAGGTIQVNYDANGMFIRSADIVVTAPGVSGSPQTLTINQAAVLHIR